MQNITRTFVRSDEMMTKYMEVMNERKEKGNTYNPFTDPAIEKIKEFDHWTIIPNGFPYDAIATTTDILFTKRAVVFDWKLLTEEEKKELEDLKSGYLAEHYDLVWENLPKGQTQPGHFHLNLLILKREAV